jgi:quercetin dioxygenase-like cupin family protein
MPVIRHADSRRTETPNAVMTTLASPTQGAAGQLVWRVDMRAGQAGPRHAIDAEQVWTVLAGAASIELDGAPVTVGPGDTVVIPADVPRRITTDPAEGLAAIVVAPAGLRAYVLDDAGRAGDKVVPAWTV